MNLSNVALKIKALKLELFEGMLVNLILISTNKFSIIEKVRTLERINDSRTSLYLTMQEQER